MTVKKKRQQKYSKFLCRLAVVRDGNMRGKKNPYDVIVGLDKFVSLLVPAPEPGDKTRELGTTFAT